MSYKFNKIEKKWQDRWRQEKTFFVSENSNKKKFYALDMFPYPSGSGLHVGHPLGYIASDIFSRYMRLKGYNVLHPMGYDSFGLPAEQYAIQTGQHPALTTRKNIERYRKQLDKIGFSYDWSREINTSNPEYYKWTQWIFKQLFNAYYCNDLNKALPISNLINYFSKRGNDKINAECDKNTPKFSAKQWKNWSEKEQQNILLKYRLAYLSNTTVNWCQELGTVLANDEIKDGVSERGGFPVEKKIMKQWSMRITAYADRLLSGLSNLDWSDSIKEMQSNWIGKSKGVTINFLLENHNDNIEVFTTRPDTIFGVNFLVLSPEHHLINKITTIDQKDYVDEYVKLSKLKSERDRQSNVNSITGVSTGAYAIHPFTGKKVEVWVGDYVLASYGTGAVMAVPCGDQRDWNFARHFNIKIINIFKNVDISQKANEDKNSIITNSDFLDDLTVSEALEKAIKIIEKNKIGVSKINYRLRDAVFSRQRYWGEPFPIFYKNETPYLVPDSCVQLPNIDKYLPTDTGEPPLARAKKEDWNVFYGDKMEYDTMPGWAGSSWYFLRYMDPRNDKEFVSRKKSDYWGQVDLYVGGAEHAVGHLLYSRFWTKFLYDFNFIGFDEPFKKMINIGMILGRSNFVYRIKGTNKFVTYEKHKDYQTTRLHVDVSIVDKDELKIREFKKWRNEFKNSEFIFNKNGKYICGSEVEKMSKSKFNTQSPDDIVQKYGSDTLRIYEMFLGPIEQFKPWNTNGISGVHNFLKKLWGLLHSSDGIFTISNQEPNFQELKSLHKTIKKVCSELERYSFNTVVSTLMICLNELIDLKCNKREIIQSFIILLSPYAPHISEEIWEKLGNKTSIINAELPNFNEQYLIDKNILYPVSFNGKTRFKIELDADLNQKEIEKEVLDCPKTIKYLEGKVPKRIIIVPKKIVNIVV